MIRYAAVKAFEKLGTSDDLPILIKIAADQNVDSAEAKELLIRLDERFYSNMIPEEEGKKADE